MNMNDDLYGAKMAASYYGGVIWPNVAGGYGGSTSPATSTTDPPAAPTTPLELQVQTENDLMRFLEEDSSKTELRELVALKYLKLKHSQISLPELDYRINKELKKAFEKKA